MTFQKLSLIPRKKLKWSDKDAYKNYKYLEHLSKLETPGFYPDPTKPVASFKHAGNAGDLIYALPAIFALAKGKPIHLFLHHDQPTDYGTKKHLLGNVSLNKIMVNMLQPLMWHQTGITSCDPYDKQSVDFNLDFCHDFPLNHNCSNIARWYFLVFAVSADLSKPWLKAPVNNEFSDAIIIARSQRHRAPAINYNFMREHGRCVFIGVEKEYEEMKQAIPQLEHKRVYDFLEMAAVINGGKLFIGNQSFPFSVAEGLKVRRMLEVYHQAPNVNPEGPDAYSYCFQPQFEKLVRELV